MWYYFGGNSPKTNSPTSLRSPDTNAGHAAAVTPVTQEKSTLPSVWRGPSDVNSQHSSPEWLSRYTDHLEQQAAEHPSEVNTAPTAPKASKASLTPKAGAIRIFEDEKVNVTPAKAAQGTLQAKRNGGRKPLMLTPRSMAKKAGGLFMLSPTRLSVSPSSMPLADSTNRPDNVTPPNANRPRLQKRTKKVKTARKIEETGFFDQENIAPQMAYRGMQSNRAPGLVVV